MKSNGTESIANVRFEPVFSVFSPSSRLSRNAKNTECESALTAAECPDNDHPVCWGSCIFRRHVVTQNGSK